MYGITNRIFTAVFGLFVVGIFGPEQSSSTVLYSVYLRKTQMHASDVCGRRESTCPVVRVFSLFFRFYTDEAKTGEQERMAGINATNTAATTIGMLTRGQKNGKTCSSVCYDARFGYSAYHVQ